MIIAAAGPDDGWRYLFLVNVPIGLVALVAVARLIPRGGTSAQTADTGIDAVGALLLGLTVLCLLYPVVGVEGGELWPLLLLTGVPVCAWAFVQWERRTGAAGRPPLLDLGLLHGLPGYTNGLLVGSTYFAGYTGTLLVLSVYLQSGLGYAPLAAGFLLMPFAVGSAIAAPLAGQLVPGSAGGSRSSGSSRRWSRYASSPFSWPAATRPGWAQVTVPVLFITGSVGGAVVSPNITLTLADVPPRMGGAAGGALQTGQRIGSAIGAAVLMTVYQTTVHAGAGTALRVTVGTAFAILGVALVMAVRALRHDDGVLLREVNPSSNPG